jgi:hypothetical protein
MSEKRVTKEEQISNLVLIIIVIAQQQSRLFVGGKSTQVKNNSINSNINMV